MGTVITIVVAVVVFIGIVWLGNSLSAEKKISKRRVGELLEGEVEESFVEVQSDYSVEKSSSAALLESLASPFRDLKANREKIELDLYRAGATSPNAFAYYVFFSTYGWLFGALTFSAIYFMAQGHPLKLPIILTGIVIAIVFSLSAKLWLKNTIEKRALILVRSFPDALDLLLVCVESGLAIDAALARVCKELKYAHPEITVEFNKTRFELTMLNDREKALMNLAKRTDLMPFKSLCAALIQSEKFGTSLVETLRVLSEDYRNTRMMIAEEKAGKLPAKIAVSSIPLMLFALLMLIMAPAIMQVMKNF